MENTLRSFLKTAVVFIFAISARTLEAQTSASQKAFEESYYGQLEALYKNPSLANFQKIDRERQIQMIVEGEAAQLSHLTPVKGTYAAAAIAIHDEAAKTLNATERLSVDEKVLTSVWNNEDVSEQDIKTLANRVFAKSSGADPVARVESAACSLAQNTASLSALVPSAATANDGSTWKYGGQRATVATQIGTNRFAQYLTPETLGAAQHVVCPATHYMDPLYANKSLRELNALAKQALDNAKTEAGRSLSIPTAANPVTATSSSLCTFTQIHDELVIGEGYLRTSPARATCLARIKTAAASSTFRETQRPECSRSRSAVSR